jgi:multimeric flavodoxin WrbA
MKIAFINGSPKAKNSASGYLLQTLKTLLHDENEILEYHFRTSELCDSDLAQIAECNTFVFAFPLYIDGIPSHLLSCLNQLETFFQKQSKKEISVYCLVNSGFYEGHQNAIALEMMKNWCEKAKLNWRQGAGIGGGGMLPFMTGVPEGKGPKKNASKALETIAHSIVADATAENIFISPNFPRFAYKLSAEMGWRQQARANGLRRKDLYARK